MFFVYILRTVSNTLYIGVTQNLDQRISTHNSGKGAEWVKANRDAHLVYCESHTTLGSARKREMQLKNWSRAKKEATYRWKLRGPEEPKSLQNEELVGASLNCAVFHRNPNEP